MIFILPMLYFSAFHTCLRNCLLRAEWVSLGSGAVGTVPLRAVLYSWAVEHGHFGSVFIIFGHQGLPPIQFIPLRSERVSIGLVQRPKSALLFRHCLYTHRYEF